MNTTKFIFLILSMILVGCEQSNNTNMMDSDDYETKEERIEALKAEIKAPSDFQDAEFELFNVNGFTNSRILLPGPSSWDYKFGIKVKLADIEKWTDQMIEIPIGKTDIGWTNEIIKKRKKNWTLNSQPKVFIRNDDKVSLILYQDEGIIFKRIIQD